jgi:putative transposase
MPKKWFSAEQIVVPLRQIEVLMSQSKGAPTLGHSSSYSMQMKFSVPHAEFTDGL